MVRTFQKQNHNMRYLYYLIPLFLLNCNNIESQKKENSAPKLEKQYSIESDRLLIKNFIKNFISNIERKEVRKLSEKFKYPMHLFDLSFKNKYDFQEKWNKDNILEGYLSLDIIDEDDKYIGKISLNDIQVYYDEPYAQFAIGNLIMNVRKINGKILITRIDTAG